MYGASTSGQLIVGLGIPSCGKSSIFKQLGQLHNLKVFVEPEEEQWPHAVHNRKTSGYFTAITWFRSCRVPLLFEALALKMNGSTVLLDSYYDKLFYHWIGKAGMEWLIPNSDSYFDLTAAMAKKDRQCLPDADVVVFFELEEAVWTHFLNSRQRKLDQDAGFLQSFSTQAYFRDAASEFCAATGAKLVTFKQRISTVPAAAADLSAQLKSNGVHLVS